MMSTAPHSTQSHSRLIRFLSDLALVDFETVNRDFAERLGLLLNFSDSILLADALKAPVSGPSTSLSPDGGPVDNTPLDAADARVRFLRARGSMVDAIVTSCVPGSTARIKWPTLNSSEDVHSFDPFWRFYAAHQREMDLGVRALRTTVREAMSTGSELLRQLVALDVVLENTLWDHSRRLLAVVPRFLEKRFNWLQQQAQDGANAFFSDWQLQFSGDLQGLLLAELDIRLQPVLGLVEALNNEVITQS